MTTALDFQRLMRMRTGLFVTQIARAVPTYSIPAHLAEGAATAEQNCHSCRHRTTTLRSEHITI
jgi:hypothetical protein